MLNLRQKDILYAVINQFMKSGEPVSSYDLYKFYDFGIKPAMIRNELLKLSEMGYLDQPYYSSGRIPTDLAYEFFIQDLVNQEINIKLDEVMINLFKKMAWEDLAEKISKNLGVLSLITNIPEEEFVYKEGLEYLIDNLDWHTKDEIKEIIKDSEGLEDKIINNENILKEENFIKIFIGKKNPLTKNKSLSIIMSDYDLDGERILILTMGPKRMNYKKAFCILKGLKNYFYSNE
ncbi:MAG: hypothetical protein QXY79_02575 [Candidatus Methanomethylicia archaeon]